MEDGFDNFDNDGMGENSEMAEMLYDHYCTLTKKSTIQLARNVKVALEIHPFSSEDDAHRREYCFMFYELTAIQVPTGKLHQFSEMCISIAGGGVTLFNLDFDLLNATGNYDAKTGIIRLAPYLLYYNCKYNIFPMAVFQDLKIHLFGNFQIYVGDEDDEDDNTKNTVTVYGEYRKIVYPESTEGSSSKNVFVNLTMSSKHYSYLLYRSPCLPRMKIDHFSDPHVTDLFLVCDGHAKKATLSKVFNISEVSIHTKRKMTYDASSLQRLPVNAPLMNRERMYESFFLMSQVLPKDIVRVVFSYLNDFRGYHLHLDRRAKTSFHRLHDPFYIECNSPFQGKLVVCEIGKISFNGIAYFKRYYNASVWSIEN